MTTDTVPTTPDTPPGSVTRVFTFGYGHVCPFTGENLIDHHVTVIAPDAVLCRDLMISMFGRAWAFEYVSLDAATRGGMYPSTEHVRIIWPVEVRGRAVEAEDPDHGRTTAVAEAKPDTLGVALGRASVPAADGGCE